MTAAVQMVKDLIAYTPELDVTKECGAERQQRYQQIIDILRRAVETGCINIRFEVAIMLHYQASAHQGHLNALYLVFHFLRKNPKKRLVMDPKEPEVDECVFNNTANQMELYGDMKEEDPPNMPP